MARTPMDKVLLNNIYNGRYMIAGVVFFHLFTNYCNMQYLKQNDIFGYDGNGGNVLKIITNLTDEEMARLKFARRMAWHWKGMHKFNRGNFEMISDQELNDRGIELEKEPYVEYIKRPPHDKYL